METDKKLTIKEWRQKLQASAPEGGHETYVGRTVRFWSIYLTRLLAGTALTPNQITTISVIIFIGGISLFTLHEYWWNIAGVALIYVSIIFDACDGEIARLKGNPTRAGAYVEPISHDIQYGVLFIPLTIGLYRSGLGVPIIYVGFAATIFKLWSRFLEVRFLGLKQYLGLDQSSSGMFSASVKQSWPRHLYFFINRNIFSSVGMVIPLLVCVLFDRLDIFVWLFMIGFGGICMTRFFRQVVYVSRLGQHFEKKI